MKKSGVIFFVLLLLLGALFFFPRLLSTSFGNRAFFQLVHKRTDLVETVQASSFSWLGPQTFEHIEFKTEFARGSIGFLEVDVPLWSLGTFFEKKDWQKKRGTVLVNQGRVEIYPGIYVRNGKMKGIFQKQGAQFSLSGVTQQGTERGLFSLEGLVSSDSPSFVRGSLKSVPMACLEQLLLKEQWIRTGMLTSLLGKNLSCEGEALWNGTVGSWQGSIHTPHLVCSCSGALDDDMITLRAPFEATLVPTPELSRWCLSFLNPLFITGIRSKDPIHIRIERDGFQIPLSHCSLSRINISQGNVNMGQVLCQNGASLASVLTILKGSSAAKEMVVWFSPLVFQLHQGILTTERMDVLIDRKTQVCTWGDIDLVQEQLRMTLGIPVPTLEHVFGIQGLRKEYVLTIPITGPIRNPTLSVEGAAVKIAALKASDTIFKGSLPGLFMKELLPEENRKIPPAKHPLPWEN